MEMATEEKMKKTYIEFKGRAHDSGIDQALILDLGQALDADHSSLTLDAIEVGGRGFGLTIYRLYETLYNQGNDQRVEICNDRLYEQMKKKVFGEKAKEE